MIVANDAAHILMKLHQGGEAKFTDWRNAKRYVSAVSFFDAPSYFAANLCKEIPAKRGPRRVLDVGCGSGIVGIYCLLEGKADFVTFTDIQCRAIAESCANVIRHVERKKIRAEQAAFIEHCPFENVPAEVAANHDLIVFNPPQIPERHLDGSLRSKAMSDPAMSYFRLGGSDGLKVVRKFLKWYRDLGATRTTVIVQLSSFIGRSLIEKTIKEYKLKYEIAVSEPVSLRPMFWKAAETFSFKVRGDRALAQTADGTWTKRLFTLTLTAK